MTAGEIRKFYVDNIRGEVDGTLDEHNLCNALLGEIAAQLAEVNETRRANERRPKNLAPLGHTADCPGTGLLSVGPHYCGHCGGYIGK